MPISEELFTKFSGVDKFTKLDLSNAYQQVVLDEVLQPYDTITTHLDCTSIPGFHFHEAQRVSNLHKTPTRLERCDVKLKKSKCAFMQSQIEYFAFIVDRHGIHPSPAKFKAILEVQ